MATESLVGCSEASDATYAHDVNQPSSSPDAALTVSGTLLLSPLTQHLRMPANRAAQDGTSTSAPER